MTERFKKYLEEQFRAIPPTKGAMDYRKETLVYLEEYAQDAKIKGMTDEDAVYHLAIDSLGDFQATLAKFNEELTTRSKRNAIKLTSTSLVIVAIIAVIGVYLLLSFLHVIPWSLSWLILVGSLFGAIICALVAVGVQVAKRKSYTIPRVGLAVSIILVATFIFLNLLLVAHVQYHYFTFLAMVIAILLLDTSIAFLTKSKLAFIESLFAIVVTASLVYVMLGIAHVMPWHPGWLLPALAGASAVGGVIVMLVHRSNKKKAPKVKKKAVKATDVDEKYYTEW